MEILYSKLKSKRLNKLLQSKVYDVIFVPANSYSIAFLKTNIPIIYLSDATFHLMINYYFFGLDDKSIYNGNIVEKNALVNANQIIYSSEWAKMDAINFYNINSKKINVFPFGSNLVCRFEKEHVLNKEVNLLFVGVDWKRKGADIAIECIDYLNKHSKRTYKLTIIGLRRPSDFNVENVNFVGFLNKNNKEEYDELIDYYKSSDMFILPTQAECAGIVFSEASMFGLPIITYDTGGISTYVINDINGYRLPLLSDSKEFANSVEKICKDNETFEKFSQNAIKQYEENLNWDNWLKSFSSVIEKVVNI